MKKDANDNNFAIEEMNPSYVSDESQDVLVYTRNKTTSKTEYIPVQVEIASELKQSIRELAAAEKKTINNYMRDLIQEAIVAKKEKIIEEVHFYMQRGEQIRELEEHAKEKGFNTERLHSLGYEVPFEVEIYPDGTNKVIAITSSNGEKIDVSDKGISI